MMHGRKKLAVVLGDLDKTPGLAILDAVSESFDVSVLGLVTDVTRKVVPMQSKLVLFDAVPDMPGYMRGLDTHLSDADAIVALGTAKLSSFQALRAALKYSRPFGVLTHEYQPDAYRNYPNIRAIQTDMFLRSNRFWPSSRASASWLQLEGIGADRATIIPPVVDSSVFNVDESRRRRFRDYIKLSESDVMILFEGELSAWSRPSEMLYALKLLRSESAHGNRFKLVFAGEGPLCRDLKYAAADLQLGDSVYFIKQLDRALAADVYNASDVTVALRRQHQSQPDEYPIHLVEGMACGLPALIPVGTPASGLGDESTLTLVDDTFRGIASALLPFADRHGSESARGLRLRVARYAVNHHGSAVVSRMFSEEISGMIRKCEMTQGHKANLDQQVSAIEGLLVSGRHDQALLEIEDTLLRGVGVKGARATLLRQKGEALLQMGRSEEASESFQKGLQEDERETVRCYRGLGIIALQSQSHEECLSFFRKVLAVIPDDSQALFGIGMVYKRLRLFGEAVYWLEKALMKSPDSRAALVALTQSCQSMGHDQRGIEILERFLDGGTEPGALLVALGQLYMKVGRLEEGQTMLDRALAGQTVKAA